MQSQQKNGGDRARRGLADGGDDLYLVENNGDVAKRLLLTPGERIQDGVGVRKDFRCSIHLICCRVTSVSVHVPAPSCKHTLLQLHTHDQIEKPAAAGTRWTLLAHQLTAVAIPRPRHILHLHNLSLCNTG